MIEITSKEQVSSSKEIISVTMDKLSLPSEMIEHLPMDILTWLLSDDLAPAAIETAAAARIHIIPKPRTKKNVYWVVGGVYSYLLLLKVGWSQKVECVLDHTIDFHDLPDFLYRDICYGGHIRKAGPLANAAKAAILIRLLELGEHAGSPSCFKLSSRHLSNGNSLLKELVGFDPRSFKRADKKGMAPNIKSQIESILGLKPPEAIMDEAMEPMNEEMG